ncbi:phytoene/squalene synthase family protein [Sphingomonas sp. CGMCC 1.13654]|uniref:Phytoene/squalene synthase family protein n=1 Tax=Sphingomonas chungangi TaxID=2683589 RepID=A0A838L3M6_9SPHN|nr:phytoene/squalene synthase family protein [Sphingomonas chungangi]MBA2933991.1 phytoene/squalene synthase family protein [Sphingomonas chungangi]MVW57737.1 phytoene/squalene synthase family protein [Sphingomonas chungangi]
MVDRAALVAHARSTIAKGSKSFAAASRLFDRRTCERAQLLYAWCRACDDIADGQVLGHGASAVQDAAARLSRMRALTAKALAGEETGDPSFDCLGVVAAETGLPARYAHDLIDGFALDAQDWRPRSEADLLRYCYHVAGTVGCMMAVVMGVDPSDEATLDRACDLGIAFQLANIARDISEDDAIDRCYLPVEWLVEVDIPPGEHMKPPFRPRLAMLARRLAIMAERYEASARVGTKRLSFRAAWAVLAAAGIYGDIAREVAARGERAWDRRVSTSGADKLGWVITAAWQAAGRQLLPDAAREGLWTRPR